MNERMGAQYGTVVSKLGEFTLDKPSRVNKRTLHTHSHLGQLRVTYQSLHVLKGETNLKEIHVTVERTCGTPHRE